MEDRQQNPPQSPEAQVSSKRAKPKFNFWMISTIILLILLFLIGFFTLNQKQQSEPAIAPTVQQQMPSTHNEQKGKEVGSLQLTIKSDKDKYRAGEDITINYAIENKSSDVVAFYDSAGELKTEVSELSEGTYEYYYEEVQRMASSIYPNEYVLLNPNEKRVGKNIYRLMSGELKKKVPNSKLTVGSELKTFYNGLYLTCPSGGCLGYDKILLHNFSKGKIRISAKYRTRNPNPRGYTLKDCANANITVDSLPDNPSSNKINHNIECEDEDCFGTFGDTELNDLENYVDSFDRYDLVVYCQHNAALSRSGWIGTLTSNPLTIEIE